MLWILRRTRREQRAIRRMMSDYAPRHTGRAALILLTAAAALWGLVITLAAYI